ncbi:MAG: diguanylate cyclase [Rhodocyclaceae bacterium]|nr:diguanylate cyclase [Rhodocyclaceae bacterium]
MPPCPSASIGAAVSGASPQTIADIQEEADQAMCQAKAQGRNRVTGLA